MGGKSIAGRAAAIKQRQKIVHAGSYWNRLEEAKKDEQGNPLPVAEVNTKKNVCKECNHIFWFKSLRCPNCDHLMNS